MNDLANDTRVAGQSRLASGLLFALASAASFGLSGSLARGLLDQGWSAGAAVTARVLIAALVLSVPAVIALRGRWRLVRDNAGLLLAYGLIAVAGCQLSYFFAVSYMQVGVALLIEYTAPVAVLAWMWLRHGQRPTRRTVGGAALAAVGLVLVLDLVSGASLSLPGVLWALGAMVGAATYFILSADETNGLPPIVLAAGGLTAGGVGLLLAGLVGVLPMEASTSDVTFRGLSLPWWLPVVALGVVTAAIAYVTGIAASRRLGSRLASFVALTEVVAALLFAWLLLDELPGWVQGVGGLLIVGGVVLVKLGEPRVPVGDAEAATPAQVAAPEAPTGESSRHHREAADR
ncbi:EamA family transporter [Epidermidibacterium keratini]|uniref:EamA family transporter n=1 Tax=Epidermidibacterium keratini TaxID=1891644 RepID=A0A7L4YK57_9ACTN|nr:DMT family transporter [Epidermidibacterium keratini]QHB99605.1 EamA family transporter [Epidermidibacterium keratini]